MGRVTEELDGEEQAELLRLIAELYIVVGGFSFSWSLVETFKQLNKKALQKSRGLRKRLQVSVNKKDQPK